MPWHLQSKIMFDLRRPSVLILWPFTGESVRVSTKEHASESQSRQGRRCRFRVARSYSGWSRAQSIIDGAKKEGRVVFYASMEAQSAQRLVAQFEKKYPFIKVDATRIGSERMATRLVAEAQGRKVQADVVNQSGFDFYGVLQKGIFESYQSPERAALPPEYKDENGLWTINSATLNVIGYNTKLVPPASVPKSFWDLTDPKWKGQLLMDENEQVDGRDDDVLR